MFVVFVCLLCLCLFVFCCVLFVLRIGVVFVVLCLFVLNWSCVLRGVSTSLISILYSPCKRTRNL